VIGTVKRDVQQVLIGVKCSIFAALGRTSVEHVPLEFLQFFIKSPSSRRKTVQHYNIETGGVFCFGPVSHTQTNMIGLIRLTSRFLYTVHNKY
jgi:hypothetical protein